MRQYDKQGKLIWVAPGALHYDLEDVEFLLPYLEDLREGNYPVEPRNSGYEGGVGKKQRHCAPFERACLVAAEVDIRLAKTGLDRYLVEDKYCNGISETELAKKLGFDELEIGNRIRSAVKYIASGKCPRWFDCYECQLKCWRKKKEKERKGVSYKEWVGHRQKQWAKVK